MKALRNSILAVAQKASVTLQIGHDQLAKKITPTPGTKAAFTLLSGAAFLLFAFAPEAFAQSLGDSADKASADSDKFKSLGVKGGMLMAVVGMISAGLKIKQRSREGENSQVKIGTIAGLVIGSVVCGAAAAILYRSGGSLGLSQSDYGQVPGQ
jgi:hypothetical protein